MPSPEDKVTLDAVELLRRIYERDAPSPLYDDGMTLHWIDVEIARFIREHGAFADLRAALSNTKGER